MLRFKPTMLRGHRFSKYWLKLKTETSIEPRLALVTLGDLTPEMRKVIDAVRKAMNKTSASR